MTKTISPPETIPGRARGRSTRRSAWARVAPQSAAAWSVAGSMARITPTRGRMTKGSMMSVMPMVTPVRLFTSASGWSMIPRLISVLLMTPVRWSSTIQA